MVGGLTLLPWTLVVQTHGPLIFGAEIKLRV